MIRKTPASKRSSRRKSAARAAAATAPQPDLRSQLAAIVEDSNDAIFSRRIDGVITTWNAAADRLFGYRAVEIIGRSSRLLLPPGRRDEFRNLLARIRQGAAVRHFETERLRKDGRLIHVALTLSPVRDASRRLVGFSTTARDITGESQMRDTLSRREHELRDLFDEASVGLVLLSRNGIILRANDAFCEVLGRSSKKVAGLALRVFHPEPAAVAAMLRRLATRQTLHNFPTELRARDGSVRHVLVDANALWERGRFVHSRWFVRDISQRKRLERELLELSEREQRAFAQELHDGLGQQLGGIAYLSNVLREKLAERNAPETAEATRIFGLVRDAIDQIRRVSRGLSPIRPGPDGLMIALRELAAQTTELFHVPCRFDCPRPVLIADVTRAGHLYRIAQEAVNNALKHAKPDRLNIRLRHVRGRFTLLVADDGKGIGPISPRRQGLGLHIMQYRAGLVRGTLTVRPRRRRGTAVICSVPNLLTKGSRRHK